jgi:hypothetical protein
VPEGKAQEPKVYFEGPFLNGEEKESGAKRIPGSWDGDWREDSGKRNLQIEGVRAKRTPVLVPPHQGFSQMKKRAYLDCKSTTYLLNTPEVRLFALTPCREESQNLVRVSAKGQRGRM